MTAEPDTVVRRAGEADVHELARLARRAAAEVAGQRGGALLLAGSPRREPYEASYAATLADDSALVLVGGFDGGVFAMAAATVDADGLARITDLYVEPEARELGLGEQLMEEVLAWAVAAGCRGIDAFALPGNREWKNFFERFGLTARLLVVHRTLDGDRDGGAGEDGARRPPGDEA